MASRIITGDAAAVLQDLKDQGLKAQCCVTSPPYWGLRDYGHPEQIGLEQTPEMYIENLVRIFDLVRDVLADDGTLWLNLGDSLWGGKGKSGQAWCMENTDRYNLQGAHHQISGRGETRPSDMNHPVIKPKDIVGIPWTAAFALRAAGWYLRADIIWNKPNTMPESVKDRPTRAHEYVFLLSKSKKYFYDYAAVQEPIAPESLKRITQPSFNKQEGGDKDYGENSNRSCRKVIENFRDKQSGHGRRHAGFNDRYFSEETEKSGMRNKRDVWTIPTEAYPGAHFATFPQKLIEPCILAGSRAGDIVLDPFFGSGTTGLVAERLSRQYIGIELNEEYAEMARQRMRQTCLELRVKA